MLCTRNGRDAEEAYRVRWLPGYCAFEIVRSADNSTMQRISDVSQSQNCSFMLYMMSGSKIDALHAKDWEETTDPI
jgi:hypothetical protein